MTKGFVENISFFLISKKSSSVTEREVIKEGWDESEFLLITLFQCCDEMALNHLYTDLTRTLICNYSYKDNSDYTVQSRVVTDFHRCKSQLIWRAARVRDCLSLKTMNCKCYCTSIKKILIGLPLCWWKLITALHPFIYIQDFFFFFNYNWSEHNLTKKSFQAAGSVRPLHLSKLLRQST